MDSKVASAWKRIEIEWRVNGNCMEV